MRPSDVRPSARRTHHLQGADRYLHGADGTPSGAAGWHAGSRWQRCADLLSKCRTYSQLGDKKILSLPPSPRATLRNALQSYQAVHGMVALRLHRPCTSEPATGMGPHAHCGRMFACQGVWSFHTCQDASCRMPASSATMGLTGILLLQGTSCTPARAQRVRATQFNWLVPAMLAQKSDTTGQQPPCTLEEA